MIGQGTWYDEHVKRTTTIAALRMGLDLGMTPIDTAEMYGFGSAEEIIAEAIAGRRDEVFLVSKVLTENASRTGTIAACERSLTRLKTDRLDCYLLHWRGPGVRLLLGWVWSVGWHALSGAKGVDCLAARPERSEGRATQPWIAAQHALSGAKGVPPSRGLPRSTP